jgi:thioredoxin 2
LPISVGFHASGAKSMMLTLGDIAAEATGQLRAVQIDVSVCPHIAERFNVRVIPTLLIWNRGVPVEFIIGWVPRGFMRHTIRQAIGAVSKRSAVEEAGQC